MSKPNLYQSITDNLIAQLESGVSPWSKPWTSTGQSGLPALPLRHNGIAYQGMNILLLWDAAHRAGYSARSWMTFNQARELGGFVRKGEKGTGIVFASAIERTEQNSKGEDETRKIPFLRSYSVFNVEQIDGLPAQYYPAVVEIPAALRMEAAEQFIQHTGARIVISHSDSAYYRPTIDTIRMPEPAQFTDAEAYYATLLHELTHWTGHDRRCNRDLTKGVADKEAYAFEELVAELGSAFLCAELGISVTPRPDHAQYLGCWLKALQGNNRLIFKAAGAAQRAAQYLRSLQPGAQTTDTEQLEQAAA